MSIAPTFFWHDFETTGADPARDRPLQFAGVRTDSELNVVDEPCVHYCRPPRDLLPAPGACVVTGIGPRQAEAAGLHEAGFAAAVLEELGRPGTCGVGYNSLRFDDEVTRHLLWRNLYDPYAREWRDGNSRWDVIDLFRLARALRPEGLEWPDHEPGVPSFRLEDLARANGIEHQAHDALGDVHATIELVRRLRAAQPRLYEFALGARNKQRAAELLPLDGSEPVLHVSGRYPSRRGCIAPVAAVARHPVDRNGIVVADLMADPRPLLELDAETLATHLFTPAAERAPGDPEIPLKVVKLNRSPVLAPVNTLGAEAASRLAIDLATARGHLAELRRAPDLAQRLTAVFEPPTREPRDADIAIYEGFVDDTDRARMDAVHRRAPADLAGFEPGFGDRRVAELYFRLRARNWPATLDTAEAERWRELRWQRLCRGEAGSPRTRAEFRADLERLRASGELSGSMAEELAAWEAELFADLPGCEVSDAE